MYLKIDQKDCDSDPETELKYLSFQIDFTISFISSRLIPAL